MPAVILHNRVGHASAYRLARLLEAPLPVRRAVSLEVGMQNAGLAAALASLDFQPAAALPAARFSVWHNRSRSILTALWPRSSRDLPSLWALGRASPIPPPVQSGPFPGRIATGLSDALGAAKRAGCGCLDATIDIAVRSGRSDAYVPGR
jgi:hypothetical protein